LAPELKDSGAGIKRLPPPVNYEIVQQPDQISLDFVKGSAEGLALVGDPYCI
jgi:hypothetical protein